MPVSGSSSGNGLQARRYPRRMGSNFGGAFGNQGDVLGVLAAGLAADAPQTASKTLKVIRARSPALVRLSESTGEDLIATSAAFIDILLTSLRSDVEVPWSDYEQRTREYGRLEAEHRTRENELYGLAAIVTAMGRSLDVAETSEVALVETVAAFHLDAGALWVKERATFRLAHVSGLDLQEIDDFTRETGPHVKASVTAIGRSESRVDRGLGDEWNALRAQLRVKGRVVGVMTVGTKMPRVYGASDLLFMAAVADQVAIALDRARQFSSEARTDHMTGLANRREFERIMEREVALAERHNRKLSLMM